VSKNKQFFMEAVWKDLQYHIYLNETNKIIILQYFFIMVCLKMENFWMC